MGLNMKIAIFEADSNGCFPVPAVKGGAVACLVSHILKSCNAHNDMNVTIFSYYDVAAFIESQKYTNIKFEWIKIPKLVKWADTLVYKIFITLFPKKKAMSFISICSLLWYVCICSARLRNLKYDRVILENNVVLSWIIKLSGYKGWYCYHLHNLPRTMAKNRKVFDNCNMFFNVSRFITNRLCSPNSPIIQIPKEKCKEYYNCIDTSHFTPIVDSILLKKYAEKYGIQESDHIILFVGRLSEEKGIDKILEAVKSLNNKSIKVLIVGDLSYVKDAIDDYTVYLQELSKSISDQIIFTGYINQSELPIIYSLSTIAVLPSVWDEPAGLTMIEAMSCGVPLITCKSGGIPEYVGECAIVLERDDKLIQNIATNIDLLINDVSMRYSLSQKGMQRVHNLFNLEEYYKNFKKMFI